MNLKKNKLNEKKEENNKLPNEKIVKHIDRCLSCYGCMTTCPAEVNYMHLIDHGRKYIEQNYERPFFDRLLRNFLSKVLPNTKYFRIVSFFAKIGKPFSFLFPDKIKDMMNLIPASFPKKTLKSKEVYKAKTKRKVAKVALLTGCVQKEISPQINEATIRILNRHGVEVVTPKKIRCCGSLSHHLGKNEDAHKDFKNNINIWYDEYLKGNLDAILSNTSGCGTTLKDYGFIFRNDKELKKKAKKISELSKDVSEYLSENLNLKIKRKEKKYKIAYHSACSMQHGQKVHVQPIELLFKTKNDILEIPEGHLCCGSAGTYNVLQNKIAKQLLKDKVKNIESLNPHIISTGNIGCITQISISTNIPILHTVELLDWYSGGPKPKALKRI